MGDTCIGTSELERLFDVLRNRTDVIGREATLAVQEVLRLHSKNSELRTLNSELRTRNSELETQNSELRTQNSELGTQNSELGTQNSELGTYFNPSAFSFSFIFINVSMYPEKMMLGA